MLLNNYTQATSSVTAIGATTIEVPLAPSVTPSAEDYLTLTFYDADGTIEIVQCTGVSGSTLTVVRGAEGTAAREWPMGSTIASRATAAVLKSLGNTTGVLTEVTGTKVDVVSGLALGTAVAQAGGAIKDMCWDGTHFWVLHTAAADSYVLTQYDSALSATGTILDVSAVSDYIYGVTFARDAFWLGTNGTSLYKVNKTTGAVEETISGWNYTRALSADGDLIVGVCTSAGGKRYSYDIDAATTPVIETWGSFKQYYGLTYLQGEWYGAETTGKVYQLNGLDQVGSALITLASSFGLTSNDTELVTQHTTDISLTKLDPTYGTKVTGTNIGSLLEVGDTVGSTTVASVDSANQVTLAARETEGSVTASKTPSNGKRVTSINGVTVWR